MSYVIYINTPSDIAYENLTNNYNKNIVIDNNAYPSVTNYILSTMVNENVNKVILQNCEIKGDKKNINTESMIQQNIYNKEKLLSRSLTKEEIDLVETNVAREVEQKKMNIYEMFDVLLKKEEEDIIYSAIEEAYKHILRDNKILEILLNTGNSELYYKSSNLFLGVNESNKGNNIVGKILMQLRHNFNEQIIDKTIKNRVYDTYVALKYLENRISNANDIDKFINKDVSYIVNYYKQKSKNNDKKNIPNLITDEDVVFDIYNNNVDYFSLIRKEITNPRTLALEVRNRDIKKLYTNVLNKRKDIVFEEYIKYNNVLKNENKEENLLLKDLILTMITDNFKLYNSNKDKLYSLFESNKLENISEKLNNNIERKLKKYQIKRDYLKNSSSSSSSSSSNSSSGSNSKYESKYDNKYESKYDNKYESKYDNKYKNEMNYLFDTKEEKKGNLYSNTKDILYITDNYDVRYPLSYFLSPKSNLNFKINNYNYLNVIIYSMAMLLVKNTDYIKEVKNVSDINQNITYKKGSTIDNIYNKYIYSQEHKNYFDIVSINKSYNYLKINTMDLLRHESLKKALKIKFKDQDMIDLLVITEEKTIIYVDKNDLYFGFDKEKNKGMNIVGHELMNIRKQILEKMSKKTSYIRQIIDDKNVNLLFNQDFIKTWMASRLGDFCKTIKKFSMYMKTVADIDEPLNVLFIQKVTELVYKPYNIKKEIFGMIKNEPELFFTGSVRECFGNYFENLSITMNDTEIEEIQKQLLNRYDKYRIIKSENKHEMEEEVKEEIKLYKDIVKKIFIDKKEDTNGYNLNTFKNIFENLISSIENKYIDYKTIEEKQRDEIKLAKDIIYAPLLSDREIKDEVEKLIEKQQYEIKELNEDVYKIKQLKNIHNKEKKELMFKLYKPKKTIKEIFKEVEEMNNKHLKEYNEYIKYFDDKISTEQLVIDDQNELKLKQQLNRLTNKKKEKMLLEINNIDSNGVFLWKYITSILTTLLYQLSKRNKKGIVDLIDVKKVIINSQYESVKIESLKCEKIINGDDYSNCIISAIINILISIENFKKEYMDDIIFSIHDVDLAISILLNEDILSLSKQDVETIPLEYKQDDDNILVDEVENVELDEDSVYGDSNYGSGGESSDNQDSGNEQSGNENYDSENELKSKYKFSMNNNDTINSEINIVNLKDKLIEITLINKKFDKNDKNLTTISNYILNKIKYIKKYNKIDIKLKINRINFFSTKINNL